MPCSEYVVRISFYYFIENETTTIITEENSIWKASVTIINTILKNIFCG